MLTARLQLKFIIFYSSTLFLLTAAHNLFKFICYNFAVFCYTLVMKNSDLLAIFVSSRIRVQSPLLGLPRNIFSPIRFINPTWPYNTYTLVWVQSPLLVCLVTFCLLFDSLNLLGFISSYLFLVWLITLNGLLIQYLSLIQCFLFGCCIGILGICSLEVFIFIVGSILSNVLGLLTFHSLNTPNLAIKSIKVWLASVALCFTYVPKLLLPSSIQRTLPLTYIFYFSHISRFFFNFQNLRNSHCSIHSHL